MNGFAWLIVNAALLLGALGSWNLSKKLAHPELPAIDDNTSAVKELRPSRQESNLVFARRPKALPMDELWEKSLFRPERTERSDSELEQTDPENEPANAEFELTGIAWIGLPGETKPVAVIKQQAATTRRRPTRMPAASRGRVPQARSQPQQSQPADKPQKVIFAVGDRINDSGYVLTEINTEENSALLVRGAERLELKIEFGSAASAERKEVAVTEAASRARQREEAERLRNLAAQTASPTDTAAAAAADAPQTERPPGPPGPPRSSDSAGTPSARRRFPREQGGMFAGSRGSRRSRTQQDSAEQAQGAQPQGTVVSPTRSDGEVNAQQQRLQQLYRESAERRARSKR